MKILHLTTVATSHQHLLLPQLVALTEAGHEVVAVSATGPEVATLEQHGIRHRPLEGSTRGFDLRADLRAAHSFARIVRDERPDVVHTHNPKPGVYGRILARALGVKHVVNTVHGLYATPDDSLRRRLVVYGLEAMAARFSHLELVQSIEDAELMRRRRLAPAARVRHLGNGIELDRFTADCPDVEREVRRELGIGVEETVVGSVGRLVAEKGFTELLAASEALDAPHALVIVGPDDPDKSDAIPRSVIDAARSRGVRFLGHRDDIDRLLPAMDIFVLASYREGVPRAAMEAAAAGLPIIATDIRGCRQVVEDGVTGTLVARAQVGSLRTALGELIANRDLRERYGKAGRAKAMAEFDERQTVAKLFTAYRELGIPCPRRDRTPVELDAVEVAASQAAGSVPSGSEHVSESYV
ncbi:MAG: glycosyltransferase family 4 protein [Acidimicrobiia bacterium]|nr:glycosyltransferase family 4 protein [Acidimicrobiia bacterium]